MEGLPGGVMRPDSMYIARNPTVPVPLASAEASTPHDPFPGHRKSCLLRHAQQATSERAVIADVVNGIEDDGDLRKGYRRKIPS